MVNAVLATQTNSLVIMEVLIMRTVMYCTAALIVSSATALADNTIDPDQLGVVEAPVAGSIDVPLALVPRPVLHSARVAFKTFDGVSTITEAQLDIDEELAIWEIAGTVGGLAIEADIRPDGHVEELEIEIASGEVPAEVNAALARWFPTFAPAGLIEKSIRPSDVGLPEIWYEFSGTAFDVEVRSDGAAAFVEPA
jgi:hypothetical protein